MIKTQTIYKSTNAEARNITPDPDRLDGLIDHLSKCLLKIKDYSGERENNQRNTFRDELLNYAFPDNEINGVGNIDIAIMNYENKVGVIFEYKRTSNIKEMMSPDNLDTKGFRELIQYYLGQVTGYHKNGVVNNKNTSRINGIVTDGFSWFVINNNELYNHFGKYSNLKKQYIDWCNGKKASTSTDYLRDVIIAPWIDKALKGNINIGYFDLNNMVESKDTMILKSQYRNQFYRFLSPQNMLMEGITADANELNTNFYNELLYLMGLKEHTKSGSKVIKIDRSQDYTLSRNAMLRIKDRHPELPEEKIEDISIQLTVTWVNRILFLKLLESQLYSFNDNSDEYKFIDSQHLRDFSYLYDLFFGVLSKYPRERSVELTKEYPNIPYLNSTLFEQTDLENTYLNIDDLRNRDVNLFKHTSLKKIKKSYSKIPILDYFLKFLDSYNFSVSYSNSDIDKDSFINASVLGLIFEKINGYKDGAYFTPGWICMKMAHESVKRVIITKVNKVLDSNYKTLNAIKNVVTLSFINSSTEPKEAILVNNAINSLKICDPSVGSGHFLVSVLNEIISIKSYLGVLFDINGDLAKFNCKVQNDDLYVTSIDGKRYKYIRNDLSTELTQKTLFEEKKFLIENCLFGVDINPNSVGICHLRLWIELLKNSYYQKSVDGEHLTTMPNIDINIKTHNSLIHMYDLDAENKFNKNEFKDYCESVARYKNTSDKNIERKLKQKIQLMEKDFNDNIYTPDREKYLKKERFAVNKMNHYGQGNLLGESELERTNRLNNYYKYKDLASKYTDKYNETLEVDPFYKKENGMEWRSGFPEILDNKGNYVGFDFIIGNPPYIFARNSSFNDDEKKYYADNYNLAKYQINTYHMFIELAYNLLKTDGVFSYIIPNNMLTIQSNLALRRYLISNTSDLEIVNSKDKLFKDAAVDNCIIFFNKSKPNNVTLMELLHHDITKIGTVDYKFFSDIGEDEPIFSTLRVKYSNLMEIFKSMSNKVQLGSVADVNTGVKVYQVGKGTPKITKEVKDNKLFHSSYKVDDSYKKYLTGSDVCRYEIKWGTKDDNNKWLKYGKNIAEMRQPEYFKGPRILVRQIVSRNIHSIIAGYTNECSINDINSMIIRNSSIDLFFILGIINSSIETFWFALKFDKFQRKTFPQFKINELKQFPIPDASKDEINELSTMVKQMIDYEKNGNEDKIKSLDSKIDNYVMDLYGLSDEDKKLVNKFNF